MTAFVKAQLASLGFLRVSLLALALVNMLLPAIDAAMRAQAVPTAPLWTVFPSIIAPVMAPLFIVVILFDYIMSRVRAADTQGEERARFVTIGRIELSAIVIMVIFWLPFFLKLAG